MCHLVSTDVNGWETEMHRVPESHQKFLMASAAAAHIQIIGMGVVHEVAHSGHDHTVTLAINRANITL